MADSFLKYLSYLSNLELTRNRIRRNIFRNTGCRFFTLAAFPKSASAYLRTLLKFACKGNLKVVNAKIDNGFGHNFISESILLSKLKLRRDLLLYGHIPYNHYNINIIEKFTSELKIIISLRPLPDVVVSYKDHVDKEKSGPLDYHTATLPECYPGWQEAEDDTKYDYVINYILPWYVRFVASWIEASKKWPTDFISFEEHTLYPADCLLNITRFLRLEIDPSKIELIRNSEDVPKKNFNVGVSGRGMKLLKAAQIDRIKEIVGFYNDSFFKSYLGKYLLYGYEALPFEPLDVIRLKDKYVDTPERYSAVILKGE
jgi:hypothetical protein